jgi:hypothetical protein
MQTTWEEIIASDVTSIHLIWYGSILARSTHEGDTSHHDTVIVKWFQRIYNLKMVPEWFCRMKLEAFMKKYWEKYGITTMEEVDALDTKYCVLNAQYTWNSEDYLNWVLVKICKKDFETYQKREEIYDLYQTSYQSICPDTGIICDEEATGYILIAHEQYLIDDGYAFLPYHNLARDGAYSYGEYFGKIFDETTKNIKKEK